METRELAANILDLEARLAANHDASMHDVQGALERWNRMIDRMITLLEPIESTRSAWRVPLTSKILVNSGGRTLTFTTTNISHTGLGVRSEIPWLAPGDEGEILLAESKQIKFALAEPFRVVWAKVVDGQCYFGLRFSSEALPEWHHGFRSWYLHAFDTMLRDLAAGETRWEPAPRTGTD